MEQTQKRKTGKIKIVSNIKAVLKQNTWFTFAAVALLIFLFFKLFVFELIVVNAEDMAEQLHTNDLVLVNKFSRSYHINDLLYFEYPAKDSGEKKTYFIQRCVAGPGDSLFIKYKAILVNGQTQPDPENIKYNYIIDTDTFELDSVTRTRYGLTEGGSISKKGKYGFSLTKQQVDSLRGCDKIRSVELRLEKENIYDERVFPYSRLFSWNADNYGKLYIPKKNDSLILDTVNIKIYGQIIQRHEKNKLEIKNDSIFVNDVYSKVYPVKQNYYFVVGDNRDNAVDSRRWGFLPQKYIRGKMVTVLKHSKKP